MKPAILLVFDVSRVSCATRQKLLNQMGERFFCYHIGIMKQERPVEVYSLDNLPVPEVSLLRSIMDKPVYEKGFGQ